jgi:hypothetical protein
MAPLKDIDGTYILDQSVSSDSKYYLDLAAIGIDETDSKQVEDYKNMLFDYFITGDKSTTYKDNGSNPEEYSENNTSNQVYAKFLYDLSGGNNPGINNCASEYITGYLEMQHVAIDENGLFIKLNATTYGANIREICHDYVKANRGKIINSDCWKENRLADPYTVTNSYENWEIHKAVFNDLVLCDGEITANDVLTSDIVTQLSACQEVYSGTNKDYSLLEKLVQCGDLVLLGNECPAEQAFKSVESFCKTLNLSKSYLRLPVITNKLGGGIRVKRLLTYDSGIGGNADEAVLFGKEYTYQLEDGSSSGVAANEPDAIREENGTVQLINVAENEGNILQNSLLFGLDKRQVDGLIGESILPAASIGYSRVVVKDIYDGKGNPGFTEYKFNTAYDYPLKSRITSIKMEDYNPNLPITYEDFLHVSVSYNLLSYLLGSEEGGLAYSLVDVFTLAPSSQDLIDWVTNGDGPIKQLKDNVNTISTGLTDLKNNITDEEQKELADDAYTAIDDIKTFINNCLSLIEDLLDIVIDIFTFNWDEVKDDLTALVNDLSNLISDSLIAIKNLVDAARQDISYQSYLKMWATQGYSIELNDMHGKPKSTNNYEGDYADINATENATLVSSTEYNYYDDSASLDYDGLLAGYENEHPGKTQEVVMESKAVKNILTQEVQSDGLFTNVLEAFINVDLGRISTITSEEALYTHVTNKITYNSAILKSVTSTADGIITEVYNDAFGLYNGSPIVVRSFDEFDGAEIDKTEIETNGLSSILFQKHNGTYENTTFPATYGYELMGPKSVNEGFCFGCSNDDIDISVSGLLPSSGSGDQYLTLSGNDISQVTDKINPGDLLAIKYSNKVGYFHVKDVDEETINLIAAVSTFNGSYINLEVYVLSSAMQNRLSENIGSLLTYGDCNSNSSEETSSTGIITGAVITEIGTTDLLDLILDPAASLVLIDPDLLTSTTLILPSIDELVNEALDVSSFIGTSVISSISQADMDVLMDNYYANLINTNATEISIYNLEFYSANSTNLDFSFSDFYNTLETYRLNNPDAFIASIENNYDYMPAQTAPDVVKILNQQLEDINTGEIQSVYYMPEGQSDSYHAMEIVNLDANHIALNLFNEDAEKSTLSLTKDGNFSIVNGGKSIAYKTDKISITITDADRMSGADGIGYAMNGSYTELNNCVIKASAIKLDDSWNLSDEQKQLYGIDLSNSNEYLSGEKGKYRLNSSWAYNADIIGGNKDEEGERIYLGAGAAETFYLFDWATPFSASGWKYASSVTDYSPHGEVLEEKNLLDIYSCAKYGYDHAIPYLVAKNASYNDVMFESFENNYSDNSIELLFEDGYELSLSGNSIVTSDIHSGKQSLLLGSSKSDSLDLKDFELSDQLLNNGMLIQLWLKTTDYGTTTITVEEKNDGFNPVSFSSVSRIGSWILYEATISDWGSLIESASFTPQLQFSSSSIVERFTIDDIRLQPANAEMACYVYDNSTLNLLTSFDSQHFGLFYQYNAEGKLIRKMAETTKGKRTISETHYNITGQSR